MCIHVRASSFVSAECKVVQSAACERCLLRCLRGCSSSAGLGWRLGDDFSVREVEISTLSIVALGLWGRASGAGGAASGGGEGGVVIVLAAACAWRAAHPRRMATALGWVFVGVNPNCCATRYSSSISCLPWASNAMFGAPSPWARGSTGRTRTPRPREKNPPALRCHVILFGKRGISNKSL